MRSTERTTRGGAGRAGGRAGCLRAGGFTLIELVAVLVLVGIVSAVAVPAIGRLTRASGATAAQQLARDLSFARARAMATGTTSWVVFDVANNAYSTLAENPASPGRAGAATITDPATGAAMVRRLGRNEWAGLSLSSAAFTGDAEVGFDRLGRPVRSTGVLHAAAGTVTMADGWQVTVQPRTGVAEAVGP